MKYRPEYQLHRLRMMMAAAGEGEQSMLHLLWLRTMVVDLSHTAEADGYERMTPQLLGGAVVERVVCKDLLSDHLHSRLLPFLTQSVSMLTLLDLRGVRCTAFGDAFFLAVADVHSSSLQRLYLPQDCSVAQSTLDRFTQLEELDATWCKNLTNVDFCSATLRVLYANSCHGLTDAGLRKATRLEALNVNDCEQVTNVSPFAHCLLELDAPSFRCGIGSAALSDCCRLQVLNVNGNDKITTLQPFAHRLRELDAGFYSALNDADLADATRIVSLSMYGNRTITTVAPFGASLRRLVARGSCMIDDAGLVTATNLVYLDASANRCIYSLAPFSSSLLELNITGSVVSQTALSLATKLIWLNVSDNDITTVQSCSRSLRHLVAPDRRLTNEGLSTATQLVTLDCRGNRNLTTIEPFLDTLEELRTNNNALRLQMQRAPGFTYYGQERRLFRRVPSAWASSFPPSSL